MYEVCVMCLLMSLNMTANSHQLLLQLDINKQAMSLMCLLPQRHRLHIFSAMKGQGSHCPILLIMQCINLIK